MRSPRVKSSIITRDSQHPPQSQSDLSTSIPETSYSISSILQAVPPPRTITNPQLPPQTAPKLRSNDCKHHQEHLRVSSRIEDLSIIATSTKPQTQQPDHAFRQTTIRSHYISVPPDPAWRAVR